MISMLGVQDLESLTGAPAAAAITCTLAVTNPVIAGGCPTAMGHMPVSQRGIFPVIVAGLGNALANPEITSGDAVTVTFSCGAARAGAARRKLNRKAQPPKARTMVRMSPDGPVQPPWSHLLVLLLREW